MSSLQRAAAAALVALLCSTMVDRVRAQAVSGLADATWAFAP